MGPRLDWALRRSVLATGLDLVAALVLAGIGVSELRSVGDDIFYRSADLAGVVLILLQTLPLVARRRAPVTVTALISASAAVSMWVGYPGTNALLAVPLALYSVGAARSRRDTLLTTLLALVTLVPPLAATQSGSASSVVVAVATFTVGAFAGGGVRVRRLYAEALEVQAAQAEHERQMEARQAVVRERTRIARELHDAIGHTVNVMVLQAGAGRMAAQVDTSKSIEALASIEEVGRATLGDIDRLLGLLDDEEDELDAATRTPAPSVRDLPALVARLRGAGLNAHLVIEGDVGTVPNPVGAATYRIVQEALTNAMKYAGHAEVRARVTIDPDDLVIDVADDGPGPPPRTDDGRPHGGRGLIGMAERVKSLRGEIHTGPPQDGGFVVRARLPLTVEPVTTTKPNGADSP